MFYLYSSLFNFFVFTLAVFSIELQDNSSSKSMSYNTLYLNKSIIIDDDTFDDLEYLVNLINSEDTKLEVKPKFLYLNPITNRSEEFPVQIKIRLDIDTLSRFSEKDMEFTVTFTIYQSWTDLRLVRNRNKPLVHYNAINIPYELVGKIWKPDISIQSAITSTPLKTTTTNDLMRVYPNGEIHYSTKLTTTVSCAMDFKLYPLDSQNCQLIFFNFGYYNNQIELSWQNLDNLVSKHSTDTLSNFKFHHHKQDSQTVNFCFNDGERSVRNISKEQDLIRFTAVNPKLDMQPGSVDCYSKNFLIQDFEFKRYFVSVFFVSYLPAICIVMIGGLSTYIDPKSSPARVSMSITSVLTISTLIQGLKASMPKVDYLRLYIG